MRVITELFKRGDIVSADALKPPTTGVANGSFSLASVRNTISSYIWGSKKSELPSFDDPIVPVAALKAAAERIPTLSGPMASADIHTVKTFATAITADNTRDAEAVIAHIVSKGDAVALFTDPTAENPNPVLGVRLGRGVVNPSDKGVLRTKAALEHMEDLTVHLESAVANEKEAATIAARAGNRNEALTRLRKKKALEAKLTGARSAASKLADVLMAVDEAESNKEAVLALETGMESLKLATDGGVTADRVDAVAADFKDMMEEQGDVRIALEQLGQESAGDDALLEVELEELLATGDGSIEVKPERGPVKTLADQAEEELAELLKGMPTPSTAEPQDPELAALSGSGRGETTTTEGTSQTLEANATGL